MPSFKYFYIVVCIILETLYTMSSAVCAALLLWGNSVLLYIGESWVLIERPNSVDEEKVKRSVTAIIRNSERLAVCASWRRFEFSWISTLFAGFFTSAWVSWDELVLDFLQ